jgi:hypothetical protein
MQDIDHGKPQPLVGAGDLTRATPHLPVELDIVVMAEARSSSDLRDAPIGAMEHLRRRGLLAIPLDIYRSPDTPWKSRPFAGEMSVDLQMPPLTPSDFEEIPELLSVEFHPDLDLDRARVIVKRKRCAAGDEESIMQSDHPLIERCGCLA